MKVKEFIKEADASKEIHFTCGDWFAFTTTQVGAVNKMGEADILEVSIYDEKTFHLKIDESVNMCVVPVNENKWVNQ